MRKTLFAALLVITFFGGKAFAQDVRLVSWDRMFQGLATAPAGNGITVTKDGRGLADYTVVRVPAKTLSPENMFLMGKGGNTSLYLVTTNWASRVIIRDGERLVERPSEVRIMFACRERSDEACRTEAKRLLSGDTELQSLEVPNLETTKSLPEGNVIFAFLMNSLGKFDY